MTPKQQYEARKAERKAKEAERSSFHNRQEERDEDMTLLVERFVVAVETIADALSGKSPRAEA